MKNATVRTFLSLLLSSLLLLLVSSSANAAKIDEFSTGLSSNQGLAGIAVAPDGAIWVTEPTVGRIARFDTNIEAFTEVVVGGYPAQITLGPDGDLWFVDRDNNRIGHCAIDTQVCSDSYYPPTPSAGLLGISSGPDGNIWFVESWADKIGKLDLDAGEHYGEITEYALPPSCTSNSTCSPFGITGGPDGNVWFTEQGSGKIAKITPAGEVTEYALPGCGTSGCQPTAIVTGADGMLWFTEQYGNRIGKISTDGAVAEYNLPTNCGSTILGCRPFGIAVDGEGNIWFTEKTDRIGRLASDGSFTEIPLHINSVPYFITTGRDGNVYFTENAPGGKLARLSLSTDMSIQIAATPNPALSVNPLTLDLTIKNNGADSATNITVIDQLSADLLYQSIVAAPGWACATPAVGASGTVTCNKAFMENASVDKLSLIVQARPDIPTGSNVLNRATVHATITDPVPSNNTAAISILLVRPTPTSTPTSIPVRIFLPSVSK